jgi:aconitate hydratase
MTAARTQLSGTDLDFYPLAALPHTSGLPMTVKVLLEGLMRLSEAGTSNELSVDTLAAWPAPPPQGAELPFLPARVLMQDFTGVPAVWELAAMG